MSQVIGETTLLSLPIELRLEIVGYALEQPDAGLTRTLMARKTRRFTIDDRYKPSTNLSIRLVCRQFYIEFSRIAIQKTLLVLSKDSALVANQQPDELLRDVKKLRFCCNHEDITEWQEYVLNKQCMHLDELDLVISLDGSANRKALIGLFRRLRNVKQVKLLFPDPHECIQLIGELLKEDHFQRYDAPNAPNLESTWWKWNYDNDSSWAVFVAQEPKPIMAEEDYMLLMKPEVDYIMNYMVEAYSEFSCSVS
jgi:hypothetical protein